MANGKSEMNLNHTTNYAHNHYFFPFLQELGGKRCSHGAKKVFVQDVSVQIASVVGYPGTDEHVRQKGHVLPETHLWFFPKQAVFDNQWM